MVSAARPLARTSSTCRSPARRSSTRSSGLVRNLIAMNAILRDRGRCSIRLVMNPDRMVINEAQRTFTYLNLYGYLTDAVIVNRVFPDEVAGGYFGAWRERQREHLRDRCARGSPRCRCCEARYFEEEVIGAEMLDRLGERAVRPAGGPRRSCTPS